MKNREKIKLDRERILKKCFIYIIFFWFREIKSELIEKRKGRWRVERRNGKMKLITKNRKKRKMQIIPTDMSQVQNKEDREGKKGEEKAR